MSQHLALTVVYEPVEDGWTQARIAEIPGVITAGPTEAEAREFLLDALREYLLSLGPAGDASEVASGGRREPLGVLIGD